MGPTNGVFGPELDLSDPRLIAPDCQFFAIRERKGRSLVEGSNDQFYSPVYFLMANNELDTRQSIEAFARLTSYGSMYATSAQTVRVGSSTS